MLAVGHHADLIRHSDSGSALRKERQPVALLFNALNKSVKEVIRARTFTAEIVKISAFWIKHGYNVCEICRRSCRLPCVICAVKKFISRFRKRRHYPARSCPVGTLCLAVHADNCKIFAAYASVKVTVLCYIVKAVSRHKYMSVFAENLTVVRQILHCSPFPVRREIVRERVKAAVITV